MLCTMVLFSQDEQTVLMYTDACVIPSHVEDGAKYDAALAFAEFMNSDEMIEDLVFTRDRAEENVIPRALLPAKSIYWDEPERLEGTQSDVIIGALKTYQLQAFVLSPTELDRIGLIESRIGQAVPK